LDLELLVPHLSSKEVGFVKVVELEYSAHFLPKPYRI
jgi:hypothetical protein